MNKNTIKLLIAGVLIFVTAFIIYTLYFKPSSDTELITTETGDGATAVVGQDVLMRVAELESVNINTEIFSSKYFIWLKDKTVSLDKEDVGRFNPFAPVGSLNIKPATATKKTTQ